MFELVESQDQTPNHKPTAIYTEDSIQEISSFASQSQRDEYLSIPSNLSQTGRESASANKSTINQPDFAMNTSFIGHVFMLDMFKLILKSARDYNLFKVLSVKDLPRLTPSLSVDMYYLKLKELIDSALRTAEENKRIVSSFQLFRIIVKTFKFRILSVLGLIILSESTQFLISYIIEKLVEAVNKDITKDDDDMMNESTQSGASFEACLFAFALTFSQIFALVIAHNWLRMQAGTMILFRNSFVRVLYSKLSSLSSFDVKQANIGKLINLVSSDFNTIEERIYRIILFFNIPFYLVSLFIIMYIRLGFYSLVGLFITLLFCPLQMYLSKVQSRMFEKKSKMQDERVVMTNEIIEGVRLLKMYAWENAFLHALKLVRNKEVWENFKLQLIEFLSHSLSQASGLVGAFITFLLVFLFGDVSSLTSSAIFSTFYLFWMVRFEIIGTFGFGILGLFEINVVLKRMISVLSLKRSSMKSIDARKETAKDLSENVVAKLDDFTAFWSEDKEVLSNLTASFKRGECVSILGKVGSGKTSLLNCFLKEVPLYSGSIQFTGNIAYVEQEPYIFSTTIRENITFGKQFDEHRYKSVIEQCCLVSDFEQMQLGDSTVIGERGIDISGGQKARISLARAVYSQADIYLLDDPLSAVDSKVAKKLFFGAIRNLTKSGACVILVTHQIHFSQFTDKVILLSHGRIEAQGTFDEIRETLQNHYGSLTNFVVNDSNNDDNVDSKSEKNIKQIMSVPEVSSKQEVESNSDIRSEITDISQNVTTKTTKDASASSTTTASVSFSSYVKLFKFSKLVWMLPIILASYAISDYTFVLYNREQKNLGENPNERQSTFGRMATFAFLYLFMQYSREVMLTIVINKGAKNLHEHMIQSLTRAPSSYFDSTPSGKIINLFTNDLNQLDMTLCSNMQDSLSVLSTFIVLTSAVLIVQPYFGIIVVFEILSLWLFVRKTSISLKATKQLDMQLRSPVFTFFNQAIAGVLPIRVFNQQNRFEISFQELTNDSARASSYFYLCQRGFGAYVEAISFFGQMFGMLFVLVTVSDPTLISQMIIFLITGVEDVQWGIRQIIQTDVAMTSTQRCLSVDEIEKEAPLSTEFDSRITHRTKKTIDLETGNCSVQQPKFKGELIFKDVKMRYKQNLDYVLKGVSFEIMPGQRVGIVGRTGAGKSSILQCLFRMVEIEDNNDGSGIWIDGLNTRKMGLHTLRSGISIIPQTPFIFAGTIRRNLDPQEEFSDSQIQETLQHIGLDKKVNCLENGIETNMTNVNSIFSIGEKQLMCLGRAILKKSKLIVLDEATANCDLHTDEFIQANLREKFVGSTLITIAHRLNTIADYDKIIVMDKGIVVESGSPFELLTKEGGSLFRQMVEHTGDNNAQLILGIATKSYQKIEL